MTQALLRMLGISFSHDQFPVTPGTMGKFSLFPKELLVEIFQCLNPQDLATKTLVNWTFKEVVERNTAWGERKRFLRLFPSLFQHIRFEEQPRSDFLPRWTLNNIQQTLLNTQHPTQELGQILSSYPNPTIRGHSFRIIHRLVVVTHDLEILDRPRVTLVLLYELQEQSPHLRNTGFFYVLNPKEKKLQKMAFGNPPTLVHEVSFSPLTKSLEIQGISGNRLLVWVTGFDETDNTGDPSNPKNFCSLQAINKDTLETEISHYFYPFPETPLPHLVNHIYLDHKICIVISNWRCCIKMGRSTIRIDQGILMPLLGMQIDHFSIQNRPNGQMEITLRGVKDKQSVSMQYTADPSDPLGRPTVAKTKLFWIGIATFFTGLAIFLAYRHLRIKK